MKALLIVLSLVAGLTTSVFAGELDNEGAVVNQTLQGTVIVRLDTRTHEVAAVKLSDVMNSEVQAQNAVNNSFQTLPATQVRSELDQDGGASSWYFYTGYNYYSYLNWYGCWYAPYYTYNYGYYTYYYYSNYYGWR
jgi:hypothetical protein